ncbi:MAG: SH3 domain-containing protein [Spirochaetaceae bacterium]|jgi:hypothetical protein|nr:SH3 domain-containing protein [Spirochaetaceae bacterium]
MKRCLIFLIFAALTITGAAGQSLQGKTMYISTKTAQVKASTGFFAGTRGTLRYGDQVTVLQDRGAWVEIRSVSRSPLSGWIKSAGLTARRITAGGSAASASASELALAGKGFNEEVEKSYREGNDLDYSLIDQMETQVVSEDDLYTFLMEGHLVTGE